jgi:hypothetical protein
MNRREFFIPTAAGAFASAHGASLLRNAPAFAQATRPMSGVTVLIIRHAEKPGGAWPGPGLNAAGQADKKSLVIRGWQRAGAWAAFFGAGLAPADFPTPAAIYAANPASLDDGEPSQRPSETVAPLAERLSLTPVTRWALSQESQLAAEIASFSGVVLICWEHKAIAASLLPALLRGQTVPGVPTKWDGARFDVVLRLDHAAGSSAWTFKQLFPRLLAGDSDTPMPA